MTPYYYLAKIATLAQTKQKSDYSIPHGEMRKGTRIFVVRVSDLNNTPLNRLTSFAWNKKEAARALRFAKEISRPKRTNPRPKITRGLTRRMWHHFQEAASVVTDSRRQAALAGKITDYKKHRPIALYHGLAGRELGEESINQDEESIKRLRDGDLIAVDYEGQTLTGVIEHRLGVNFLVRLRHDLVINISQEDVYALNRDVLTTEKRQCRQGYEATMNFLAFKFNGTTPPSPPVILLAKGHPDFAFTASDITHAFCSPDTLEDANTQIEQNFPAAKVYDLATLRAFRHPPTWTW